jgi:hypothetical protein
VRGAVADRPALRDALDYARSGDALIVWKLDRLARSMKQLIETIENLRLRNIGFRSLRRRLTRRPHKASWCSACSARLRNLSTLSFGNARAWGRCQSKFYTGSWRYGAGVWLHCFCL